MLRNSRGLLCALVGLSVAISRNERVWQRPSSSSGDLMVGFAYVGPKDDYGYNQAHAHRRRGRQEDSGRQGGRGRTGRRRRLDHRRP